MFDICTHIGRKLKNERDENESGELRNTDYGYYGKFPTNLLAEECEGVLEKHKYVEGNIGCCFKQNRVGCTPEVSEEWIRKISEDAKLCIEAREPENERERWENKGPSLVYWVCRR